MTSEYEQPRAEPRDRTKLLWAAVVLAIGLMIFALFRMGDGTPRVSEVRARHILFTANPNDPEAVQDAWERANAVRNQLEEGASFTRLAREHSDDTQSARRTPGGDLGYHPRDTFADQFEEYVWEAPIGELSPVIQTHYGFHIVEVLDRRWSPADQHIYEIRQRSIEELGRERLERTQPGAEETEEEAPE